MNKQPLLSWVLIILAGGMVMAGVLQAVAEALR